MKTINWNEVFTSGRDYEPMNRLLLDKVLAASGVGGHPTTIDLGCGTGELTRLLAERGATITGVDVSSVAISMAQEANPSGTYQVADLNNRAALERLVGHTYDLAFCKLVLSFIQNKHDFLTVAGQLLTDDGALILITPVRYSGHDYTMRWLNISIEHDELLRMLRATFDSVELLHTDYRESAGAVLTFILKDPKGR